MTHPFRVMQQLPSGSAREQHALRCPPIAVQPLLVCLSAPLWRRTWPTSLLLLILRLTIVVIALFRLESTVLNVLVRVTACGKLLKTTFGALSGRAARILWRTLTTRLLGISPFLLTQARVAPFNVARVPTLVSRMLFAETRVSRHLVTSPLSRAFPFEFGVLKRTTPPTPLPPPRSPERPRLAHGSSREGQLMGLALTHLIPFATGPSRMREAAPPSKSADESALNELHRVVHVLNRVTASLLVARQIPIPFGTPIATVVLLPFPPLPLVVAARWGTMRRLPILTQHGIFVTLLSLMTFKRPDRWKSMLPSARLSGTG